MILKSIVPRTDDTYIEPVLLWDIVVSYEMGKRVPLGFNVIIHTEDQKILGVARPSSLGIGDLGLEAGSEATKTIEQSSNWQVVLPLSAKHLDHLEELRARNPRRDVVLQCHVEVQFLVSKVVNAYLRPGPEIAGDRGKPLQAVVYDWQAHPFQTQYNTMWILSGEGGRTFVRCETKRFSQMIVIRASDWVHDYLSPWRQTRYVLIELPQPEILTSAPGIEGRVNAAIEAVKKASENLAKGEWTDVIEDLRPVWELVRKHSDIKDLLKADGYTEAAVKAFDEIMKQHFELASKFAHRLDRAPSESILPELHASREDAQFCFSNAMTALNLISRKSLRRSNLLHSNEKPESSGS